MKAGYGRGYYGQEQLAKPPARRGSGWIKWALAVGVVGAGTVIWLMWPRKPDEEASAEADDDPRARSLPPGQLVPSSSQRALSAPPLASPCFFPGAEARGPSHSAEARGFPHNVEARGLAHGAEARGFSHGGEARGFPYNAEARGFSHGGEARGFPYNAEVRGFPHNAEARGLSHGGEARGLSHSTMSQQAYEDAVVASARQLQATGAKVVLAPHLAHLASRIAS